MSRVLGQHDGNVQRFVGPQVPKRGPGAKEKTKTTSLSPGPRRSPAAHTSDWKGRHVTCELVKSNLMSLLNKK